MRRAGRNSWMCRQFTFKLYSCRARSKTESCDSCLHLSVCCALTDPGPMDLVEQRQIVWLLVFIIVDLGAEEAASHQSHGCYSCKDKHKR
jgi:hypothetical protein